jgi:putative transposase
MQLVAEILFLRKPHGRPCLPTDLQRLIAGMARANRTWGEERIASERLLRLGIRVSPRTVSSIRHPRRRDLWTPADGKFGTLRRSH